MPLDNSTNNRNNALPQNCVKISLKLMYIETISLSLSSCFEEALNFTIRSRSSEVPQDDIFEKFKFVFRGLEFCKSASKSYLVQGPAGKGWHIEYGSSWLASVPTLVLQTFVDLRMWVSSATGSRANAFDRSLRISSWFFESQSFLLFVNGQKFALVELWRQMWVRLGKVYPK